MFDLDIGKMVVFGIVALAVIPPKDLPRVMRTVGKYVGQMRRMAADFQGQFMDALKEADVDSVKKEFQALEHSARVDTHFDPVSTMRSEITKAADGIPPISAPAPIAPAAPLAPEAPLNPTLTPSELHAPEMREEASRREVIEMPLGLEPEPVVIAEHKEKAASDAAQSALP